MKGKMSAKKYIFAFILSLFLITFSFNPSAQQRYVRESIVPIPLLSEEIMDLLINEVSGEIQLNNEKLLAAFNHNRAADEYEKLFYESKCVFERLKEYGIEECGIEEVPVMLIDDYRWDAETAELWMLQPEKRKLTCLADVPSCLCEKSHSCDVTAELVYVGPGSEDRYYEGKNVKDKIVLVTERPFRVQDLAVHKYGAKGMVIYNSSHPEHDPDQVGWDTLARSYDPYKGKKNAFGFMVSTRMGEELRKMLERGEKVVLHAQCKTKFYPARNEIVWALIKGSEKPDEELIFTAHLFEEAAKQGANDNVSGAVSILETARVINKLIKEGKIPALRRSIRFLWVDEGAGTLGYIKKHPELVKRFFANINEDMVGEGLIKNLSSFHLTPTPYSLPSYLNDVLANFIEFVGETNRDNIINRPVKFVKPILSATGSKDPFYYHIEKFYGGSDHVVFIDGGMGIPGIMLHVWPDMWYHTNLDRPDKSDSTQLKRVSIIDTAAALYLATASKKEAFQIAGEIVTRGAERIAEQERRAYDFISKSEPDKLVEAYKEARNIIQQAYAREEKAIRSASFFAPDDNDFVAHLDNRCKRLSACEQFSLETLHDYYKCIAEQHGIEPQEPQLTTEERRLDELVPKRTDSMKGYFDRGAMERKLMGKKLPVYDLRSQEDFEIRNFVNNERSILEIRNAASAEFRPIPLKDVENYIKLLEMGGMVTIEKKDR
jgi:aminopeptidase YwaD